MSGLTRSRFCRDCQDTTTHTWILVSNRPYLKCGQCERVYYPTVKEIKELPV